MPGLTLFPIWSYLKIIKVKLFVKLPAPPTIHPFSNLHITSQSNSATTVPVIATEIRAWIWTGVGARSTTVRVVILLTLSLDHTAGS